MKSFYIFVLYLSHLFLNIRYALYLSPVRIKHMLKKTISTFLYLGFQFKRTYTCIFVMFYSKKYIITIIFL